MTEDTEILQIERTMLVGASLPTKVKPGHLFLLVDQTVPNNNKLYIARAFDTWTQLYPPMGGGGGTSIPVITCTSASGTTYIGGTTPVTTSLTSGDLFIFIPDVNPTNGSITINIDSLGPTGLTFPSIFTFGQYFALVPILIMYADDGDGGFIFQTIGPEHIPEPSTFITNSGILDATSNTGDFVSDFGADSRARSLVRVNTAIKITSADLTGTFILTLSWVDNASNPQSAIVATGVPITSMGNFSYSFGMDADLSQGNVNVAVTIVGATGGLSYDVLAVLEYFTTSI